MRQSKRRSSNCFKVQDGIIIYRRFISFGEKNIHVCASFIASIVLISQMIPRIESMISF